MRTNTTKTLRTPIREHLELVQRELRLLLDTGASELHIEVKEAGEMQCQIRNEDGFLISKVPAPNNAQTLSVGQMLYKTLDFGINNIRIEELPLLYVQNFVQQRVFDLTYDQFQRLTGGENGDLQVWLEHGFEEARYRVHVPNEYTVLVELMSENGRFTFCKLELPSYEEIHVRGQHLVHFGLEAPFLQDEETDNGNEED